jgi:YfiH family protein
MGQEIIREYQGLSVLKFSHLLADGVPHGFSLRSGGVSAPPYDSLNLGFHVGDDRPAVRENRKRLAEALNFSPCKLTVGQQVHGASVVWVTRELCGRGWDSDADAIPGTDGLITGEPGVVLMAHAADCTLLFFYHAAKKCVGLAHAGWRGAVAGTGTGLVEKLARNGCRRETIRVALSPSVGPCCYRVGREVAELVPAKYHRFVLKKCKKEYYFDLPGFHRLQLLEAGISEDNLLVSEYCTSCHGDKFFSYRAAGGRTGRMAGVISLPETGP